MVQDATDLSEIVADIPNLTMKAKGAVLCWPKLIHIADEGREAKVAVRDQQR